MSDKYDIYTVANRLNYIEHKIDQQTTILRIQSFVVGISWVVLMGIALGWWG